MPTKIGRQGQRVIKIYIINNALPVSLSAVIYCIEISKVIRSLFKSKVLKVERKAKKN